MKWVLEGKNPGFRRAVLFLEVLRENLFPAAPLGSTAPF